MNKAMNGQKKPGLNRGDSDRTEEKVFFMSSAIFSEIVLAETEEKARQLVQAGWVLNYNPEMGPPSFPKLWILGKLRCGADMSDKVRDLWDMIGEYSYHCKMDIDEKGQVISELYERWQDFKAQLELKTTA